MPGVTRTSLNTASQSSSFSRMLRGSPANPNRPNRVPPAPTPHEGTATRNCAARATRAFGVDVPARELEGEVLEVFRERPGPGPIVFLDMRVGQHDVIVR